MCRTLWLCAVSGHADVSFVMCWKKPHSQCDHRTGNKSQEYHGYYRSSNIVWMHVFSKEKWQTEQPSDDRSGTERGDRQGPVPNMLILRCVGLLGCSCTRVQETPCNDSDCWNHEENQERTGVLPREERNRREKAHKHRSGDDGKTREI